MDLHNINSSAYEYTVSARDEFELICKPIFKLGVRRFSYMKIFNNGSYLSLDSNLQFRQKYLSTIKKIGNVFVNEFDQMRDDNYRRFLVPNDINQFNKKTDDILHFLYDSDVWNIFDLYRVNKAGFVEAYSFSMTRNDSANSTQFYINNLHLLEHFIHYFNQRARHLINANDKRKLAYLEETFDFHSLSRDEDRIKQINQFLEDTKSVRKLIKGVDGEVTLSNREAECLHYLSLGNSAKEIANIMHLSTRTVECYLNLIKQKTGYYSRSKLVTNFIKSGALKFSGDMCGTKL